MRSFIRPVRVYACVRVSCLPHLLSAFPATSPRALYLLWKYYE